MEDLRKEDEQYRIEDERVEFNAAASDDEVPFHIPRD